MVDTTASVWRKIGSAGDLRAVVRAMKAQAAASVGQYEKSVAALGDYARTVELGLTACFREDGSAATEPLRHAAPGGEVCAIVIGSDQGPVGRFNDIVIDFALDALRALPGKPQAWAVGDRVRARLADAGVALLGKFGVPGSVQTITPLVFRACAESLASENASRLAAMDRADRNIDELLKTLQGSFHRLRQSGIDEELFDVTAGFNALSQAADATNRARGDVRHRTEHSKDGEYGEPSSDLLATP